MNSVIRVILSILVIFASGKQIVLNRHVDDVDSQWDDYELRVYCSEIVADICEFRGNDNYRAYTAQFDSLSAVSTLCDYDGSFYPVDDDLQTLEYTYFNCESITLSISTSFGDNERIGSFLLLLGLLEGYGAGNAGEEGPKACQRDVQART